MGFAGVRDTISAWRCGYQPRSSIFLRIPRTRCHSQFVVSPHSHLRHWNQPGSPCFLTWRLAGSLPVQRIAESWTTEGAGFLAFDKVLDARATGPQWLTRPGIARAVIGALYAGQRKGFYELGSWVVMPNHVHALICPVGDLSKIVSGIKVTSAKEANRLLNRTGAFRSRDYFDRCARNSAEERRIMSYIENNPVKAGLCRDASAWAYSSASGVIGTGDFPHGDAATSRVL
jgi:REP element-mobilizing transposase RayT